MPRQPRLDLPDIPQHVIQRGNDRQPCFFSESDRERYLAVLHEAALRYGCAVHAFVLMTNHVHLLVTPSERRAVSRMMQYLGRDYVAYVNAAHRRSGTLWEGRYRSCLVDSDRYLLTCQRYIELNPVRAGLVLDPGDYRWSSYQSHARSRGDPLLTPHPVYLALGATPQVRSTAYAELVREALSPDDLAVIRMYVQQQRALGSTPFQTAIEAQLGRCARVRPARRPTSAELQTEVKRP